MLKLLLSLSSLVFVPMASAKISGLYVGGHIGAVMAQGTHVYSDGTNKVKSKINAKSYVAGGHAGYLHNSPEGKMVIGGEVYASIFGVKPGKQLMLGGTNSEGKATLSHKNSLGIALLTGALVNPRVALYAKVGIEMSRFEFAYKNLAFQTPNKETFKKKLSALAPGGGIMYFVSDHIVVGAEYTLPVYKKIVIRKDTVISHGAKRGYTYTPKEHRLALKIAFKF